MSGLPATTYSVALGATAEGTAYIIKSNIVPDTNGSGNCSAVRGGTHGTMATGDVMIIKGPDGSKFIGTFDSETTTYANPVIRKKYG